MAKSLKLFIGKRRSNRKSNNSTDEETNYPDTIEPREQLLSTSDESENNTSNDAIMTALDITGTFSQKLEVIPSKLNCIEKTTKNIEESLSALNEKVKKLETSKKALRSIWKS